MTGPLTLKLFAATSAPDTDFTAKLVDVRPDGYAQNLADGIIRARFRDSTRYPTLITPGQVYEYTVDLWATSHVFKAGHRIRLEVSSSNFPRFDRNPNTGHPIGADAELETAQQTIFHDQRYPSHLVLPVIPVETMRAWLAFRGGIGQSIRKRSVRPLKRRRSSSLRTAWAIAARVPTSTHTRSARVIAV